MTSRTHIVQSNGMSRGPLVDSIRPYPDAIRFSLNRMNGTSFWAYSLWRAPDDADLLADIPLSDEYVQCAGKADAMTIELRTVDPDGTAHQFTVGKPGGEHAAARTEVIWWDDDRSSTTVHPHEMFTADEAADVFYSYFLTDEVSAPYVLREVDITASPARAEATADRARDLIFSDDDEHEQTWRPSNQDGQQSAAEAFWEFVSEHSRDDNASFCIEDDQNSEALLVMLGAQTICRARSEPSTRTEYRIVTNDGTYGTLVQNFVRGGFAALDRHGPWWPDVPSLLCARLRLELDESPLRRTHPRELCRRLEILTFVDGREPTTIEGVTHYGFADGDGGSVNAWMAADGRGLLVTFDPASALRSSEAGQHADLYAGVPTDLLAMVRDVAQADPTLNVASPDGRSGLAATGVFHFSGPCAMADGLVSCLQENQLGIDDTGVNRLLEAFLELDEFTPQAVAHAADWWSIDDVERGFTAAAEARHDDQTSAAPLDREAVRRFCQIWDDSGYNDRWDVHYVFFDSWSVEQAGAVRDELLGLIRALGLQRVDAPRGSATGEVWVRTDPRIDFELGDSSHLAKELARLGIAERWYRWCDRAYDWSAEATGEYEQDSLLTERGGFSALSIDEFMQAYRAAGATVTRGTAGNADPQHRSFIVEVAAGQAAVRLEVRLGRGLNSQDCTFAVLVDGDQVGSAEALTTVAHDIVQARGEKVPHPDAPYPRPIISSRSHLEVSARELVMLMSEVAREWQPGPAPQRCR